jgi:hypothetical protein
MNLRITKKQHDDISAFFDLVRSDSGVIEGFFLKPDGKKITEYYNDRQSFVQSVVAYNHGGFTCYAGIQPRKAALLGSDLSATGAEVAALRLLGVDLDACKPLDESGNKLRVNASDVEKEACLTAARRISSTLTNGTMGYGQPVLMDSGSGCWLFMPIPEIAIDEGNRREIAIRLKTWGQKVRKRFQQDGIDIDESIFELHRLTKIPGTKVFSYPDEPDRPQRVSAFISETMSQPDEKLLRDFLAMPIELPPEQHQPSTPAGRACHDIDRIFERCYLMKFLADKGSSGVSMPHSVRIALSTFGLPLGDLENDLAFIGRIIGGCPDFSASKTRRNLELNRDKVAPYGCDALRDLVQQHFKDFDTSRCQCSLPVSHDQAGNPRKPSPIRFASIMPEDLTGLFSTLTLTGDPFQNYLQLQGFSEQVLTQVDPGTAKSFLASVREDLDLKQQTINDLLKARKAAATEDTTQGQRLIELAEEAEVFRTPAGQVFATVPVHDHKETWPLKSGGFKNWLKRCFYQETGKPPSSQPLQDALGILEAKGQFDGEEHSVFTRVAGNEDAIYIDLGNDRWEAIEITPSGWNVVRNCPVRFRRARGMNPLPHPVKGRSLDTLKRYLNLSSEDDFTLIVAWLVAAMRPVGPYPVLVFSGEQGTAKSTATRIIKSLLDPSSSPLRTTPTEVRDLMIGATNNWILSFDNLSGLPIWASDAICRLSTGGGFSTRELYSDDQETIFDAMRGVILNGIEDIVVRHDLADRSIIVNLSPIPEDRRIPEKALWADFNKDAPGILGALCDAVSCALRHIGDVELDRLPRMADFALWVTAAEPALPWPAGHFMKAYQGNLKEVIQQTLDADVIASAVRSYVKDHPEGFEGSPTDLLDIFDERAGEKVTRQKYWPKAPNVLTGRLKRAATSLRASGIEVNLTREGRDRKRTVRITHADGPTRQATEPSTRPSATHNDKDQSISYVARGADAVDDADGRFPSFSQTRDHTPSEALTDDVDGSAPLDAQGADGRVRIEI